MGFDWSDFDAQVAERFRHSRNLSREELGWVLTDEEINDIAKKALMFCTEATGIKLFPYQEEFGLAIIQSLLFEDGEEVVALFARQSGKTEVVATIVVGLMVLLPILAKTPGLSEDSRISKFADGLWVGLFGPSYATSTIMHRRMAQRMSSPRMKETLMDPEISINLEAQKGVLTLPNGSFVDCMSAAPAANIEGRTYKLIITEETQDISNYKLRKSIHPMAAATNGTIIKIGTPARNRNDFYEVCQRGKRDNELLKEGEFRHYFEYDFETAAKYNQRYARYVEKEVMRLGYDSEEFRMSYRLHWLVDRGMFLDPIEFEALGIKHRDKLKAKGKPSFSRPDYPPNQDLGTPRQVAGLDIGRSNDATVLTVARVWWDNPVAFTSEDTRYYMHIQNWLYMVGDNHEKQYPRILAFLDNYSIETLVVDSTGRGDPIADRLMADRPDINVVRFQFNQVTKHKGYTLLQQEITHKRFTYPAGTGARKQTKWKRFVTEFEGLEKRWSGRYMKVAAPTKGNSDVRHDDFPDSAMLCCWGVNRAQPKQGFQRDINPFFRYNSGALDFRGNGGGKWGRTRGKFR